MHEIPPPFVVTICEIPFKFLLIFTIKFKLQIASFIFVSVAKDRDFVVTSCEILFKFLVIFTIKFKLQIASFIFVSVAKDRFHGGLNLSCVSRIRLASHR